MAKKISFPTKIDIPEKAREELVTLLNQQLADNTDLYTQTKQAHWNVKGMHFFYLHEMFDTLAEGVQGYSDMLAERVTTLGGYAKGTVRMAAGTSSLPEYPTDVLGGKGHVAAIRDRFAAYAASTRKAIAEAGDLDDPTTEDLFTEISRQVDLNLYFLEGHLQEE